SGQALARRGASCPSAPSASHDSVVICLRTEPNPDIEVPLGGAPTPIRMRTGSAARSACVQPAAHTAAVPTTAKTSLRQCDANTSVQDDYRPSRAAAPVADA